jgi:putative transposase
LNREIRRRSDVVGIFPSRKSIIRLIGAALAEYNDEWMVTRSYMPVGGLEKAQADTGGDSNSARLETGEEPALVK